MAGKWKRLDKISKRVLKASLQMANPKRIIDWPPIRKAFLEAEERPTFLELSTEFGIPEERIRSCAADEGWALLRTRRTAALIERTGAHDMLLKAAAMQQAVTDRFSGITLSTIESLEKCLQDLDTIDDGGKKLAASTRSGILNTISFAIANLARALKESGVVGLPRALMDQLTENMPKGEEGKEYLRNALQQINLTVNLAREGKAADTVVLEPVIQPPVVIPGPQSREAKEIRKLVREAEQRSREEFESVL